MTRLDLVQFDYRVTKRVIRETMERLERLNDESIEQAIARLAERLGKTPQELARDGHAIAVARSGQFLGIVDRNGVLVEASG